MRAILFERNDDLAMLLPHIFEHLGIRMIGVRTEESFWAEEETLQDRDILVLDCSVGDKSDYERCTRIVTSTRLSTFIIHPPHNPLNSLESITKAPLTRLASNFSLLALVAQLKTIETSFNDATDAISLPRLSNQETRVLQLMEAGFSNDEIASSLGVHIATVKTYLSRIRTKWGIATREDIITAYRKQIKMLSSAIK